MGVAPRSFGQTAGIIGKNVSHLPEGDSESFDDSGPLRRTSTREHDQLYFPKQSPAISRVNG
jgi:hypothetical protein